MQNPDPRTPSIATTIVAAVGAGIYEARQAQSRELAKTLQQRQAALIEQIQQLQRERDDASNTVISLAAEHHQRSATRGG